MKYLLGIIAVALLGAALWLMLASGNESAMKSSGQKTAPTTVAVDEGPKIPESGTGSLAELRALGEDIECSISYEDESGSMVEGTYFVSDDRIRGDFLTDSPDLTGQVLSSMIMDGNEMYMWSEIEEEMYGMKMTVPEEAADATSSPSAAELPVAMDQSVEYKCSAWTLVDPTIFEPPRDVLFQDYSELMQTGMEYGTIYPEGEF